MSLPAFYLEAKNWQPQPVLDGQEARHVHVLRLGTGDEVLLMDGRGRSGIAQIEKIKGQKVELSIKKEDYAPPPASRAIIALALSKAARRGFFMEKASELGAAGIWLWQADHSQGKLTPQMADSLKGQLVAGMKQSHNPWLPEIRLMRNADEVAQNAAFADYRILPWEEIDGSPLVSTGQLGRPGLSVYAIGPEGGFSDRELQTFRASSFVPVSLGKRVLRCETAASLCLGLHWWASQLPDRQENKGL